MLKTLSDKITSLTKFVMCVIVLTVITAGNLSATIITIGTATTKNSSTASPSPFSKASKMNKIQYIWEAAELSYAGLSAGSEITHIGFNVYSLNSIGTIDNFKISMKHTTNTNFPNLNFITGATTVLGPTDVTPVVGWNTLQLSTTFTWDGTSNLLVQICSGSTSTTTTANASCFYSTADSGYPDYGYQAIFFRHATTNACSNTTGTRSYARANVQFTYDPCPATLSGGTLSLYTGFNCNSETVNLSLTGYSTGTGITQQLYKSSDGINWTVYSGWCMNYNFCDVSLYSSTYFRYATSCEGNIVYSNTLYVPYPDLTTGDPIITSPVNCNGQFSVSLTTYPSASEAYLDYTWWKSTNGTTWAVAYSNSPVPEVTLSQSVPTYYKCESECLTSVWSSVILVDFIPPSGGTTTCNYSEACPEVDMMMNVTGGPNLGGQTYQWQKSLDGTTWADIPPDGVSFTESWLGYSQTVSTYYRRNTICGSYNFYSTPVYIPMANDFYDCYCNVASTGSNANNFPEIFGFTLNSVSNLTDCITIAPGLGSTLSGFSNYKSLGTFWTLEKESTVNYSIAVDECDSSPYNNSVCGIAIDFNHNGLFSDPGETVLSESVYLTSPRNLNGTFVVPSGASTGITGMRVITMKAYSNPPATVCPSGLQSFGGEIEEYLVDITPAGGYVPIISFTPLSNPFYSSSARTVAADITDGDGNLSTSSGSEPTLWYKIGSGSFVSVPMISSFPNSASKNSDKIAATYQADIPGQSPAELLTSVSYFIAAKDEAGNVTTSPAGGSGTSPPGSTPPSSVYTYIVYPPVPPNNDCSNAVSPDWVNSISLNNSSATQDAENDQSCGYQASSNKSVWYTFTVPSGETWKVKFSTEGNTNFNTVIELFSGTCGSLTSIECDDDGGETPANSSLIPSTVDGPPPYNSFGEYRTLNPGTYYLLVSGSHVYSGTFELTSYREITFEPVTNGGNPISNGIVNLGGTENGIVIGLSGGSSNPTSITGETKPGQPHSLFNHGVHRSWKLNITGGTGSITLKLRFLQSEMPAGMIIGGTAEVWIRTGGIWVSLGTGTVVDDGGGYAYVQITVSLSSPESKKYTNLLSEINGDVNIGNENDPPLYVNLISVTATQDKNEIVLKWTTASENNNLGFIVYSGKKSAEAQVNFTEISSYLNNPQLVGMDNSSTETNYSFRDFRDHEIGEEIYYLIADVDKNGTVTKHFEHQVSVTFEINSENVKKFASYELKQNHPNPFNPETTIEFTISKTQNVEVSVYNVNGQLVKTLVNQTLEGNAVGTSHKVIWDGTDASGNTISSGIYFYQIKAGNFVQTKKATFLK